jgi:hypothetical protein
VENFRFRQRKKKGAKKKETYPGGFAPRPPGFIALVPRWLSKTKGEQKTKPDISFVKKTGHFNLSRTGISQTL